MHGDVIHELFLEPLPPSCHLHEVILCTSVPWVIVRTLKARLGSEIGYSDVNTQKGYYPYQDS